MNADAARNPKHNCEQWRLEGMGCFICRSVIGRHKPKEWDEAHQAMNWHYSELQLKHKRLLHEAEVVLAHIHEDIFAKTPRGQVREGQSVRWHRCVGLLAACDGLRAIVAADSPLFGGH